MSSKPQACSSSLESIRYNEDIITEISLFLPSRSIIRFRSVSKQWYSLLTHPYFIKRHASHKSANSMLIFRDDSYRFKSLQLKGYSHNFDTIDFDYMKNSSEHSFDLVSSCNGLLLFQYYVFKYPQPPQAIRFYVCNPSTREYTELKVADSIATTRGIRVSSLAFNPSKSPHYKVIFLWNESDRSLDCRISVYSSETRTCRQLDCTLNRDDIRLQQGVFLNDSVHWVARSHKLFSLTSIATTTPSLYFDINKETIKEFPRPPYSSLETDVKYFGECRGHLHLIFYQRSCVFDVYELKDDYSCWFAKYKVDLNKIAVDFPEMIKVGKLGKKHYSSSYYLSLLEEEEEDPTLVLKVEDNFVSYNLIDKSTKKLCEIPYSDRSSNYSYSWTFHCNESLHRLPNIKSV